MKTLLIDGWMGNHRRLEDMRRRLSGSGDVRIWSYDSSGRTGLEALGGSLAVHLEAINAPFHVVAYSMGGLVLREAMRQRPDLRLQRVAFLHTPHQGTVLAHAVGLPAVRQMRPGNPFLQRLDGKSWHVPALNVWCPGDLIVVPGWNARWTRATQELRCDVPAHVWPIYSGALHQTIHTFFEEDREKTEAPSKEYLSKPRTKEQEPRTHP